MPFESSPSLIFLNMSCFEASKFRAPILAKFQFFNSDVYRTLIVLREMGAITNSDYRTINGVDTLTASSHLRKLRDQAILEKKGRGSTTYYTLAPHIATQPGELTPHIATQPGELSYQISSALDSKKSALSEFPDKIMRKIRELKGKTNSEELQNLIMELCSNRSLNANEIASILGRSPRYIREYVLKRMIIAKKIRLRFPDRPNHPQQAYRAFVEKEK